MKYVFLVLSWVPMSCAKPERGPVRDDEAQEWSDVAKSPEYAEVHIEKSTPVIQSWKELRPGDPVARLASVTRDREWIDHSLIQQIGFQTGKWYVHLEKGHTVFRLYPYMSAREARHPPCYQGIVIKVNASEMSAEALVRVLREGEKEPALVEFSIFGKDINLYQPKVK